MAKVVRMGQTYSAEDITVNIAGVNDIIISGLSYDENVPHIKRAGFARDSNVYSLGASEYSCSVTLPIEDVRKFEKIAPRGKLYRIKPFPIVVTYLNDENELIVDKILCKFQGNGREVTEEGLQNRTVCNIKYQIPKIAKRVDRNELLNFFS